MSKIKFESSDGKIFECNEETTLISRIILNMNAINVISVKEDNIIRFNHKMINNKVLKKLIQWMDNIPQNYSTDVTTEGKEKLSQWELEFFNIEDTEFLMDIYAAAKYLDIKKLLDVAVKITCQKIKGE